MKPVIRVSSIDKLLRCHGSIPLTANKQSKSGKEANDGNWFHWQTGATLIESYGATAGSDFREPTFPKDYEPPIKDSWVIDSCVNNGIYSMPKTWSMIVEDEFEIEYPNFILRGHIDLVGICPDIHAAVVKDWKTGSVLTDPAECNYQIMGYGILVWRTWPSINWMKLGIFQPRAYIGEETDRDSEEYIVGQDQFKEAEAFLVAQIDNALANYLELSTGEKQCRWCEAFFNCPAIKKEAERMELLLSENDLLRASKDCSNDDLAALLHSVKLFKPRFDDITNEVKERIDAGEKLVADGQQYSVQKKAHGYKVVDERVFLDSIRGIVGQEAMDSELKIPMGTAQRLIASTQKIQKCSKVEGKVTAETMIHDVNEGNLKREYRKFIITTDVADVVEGGIGL